MSRSSTELSQIYTMSEGFEHRLKANIQSAPDFDTLMSLVKTKRFTYTHIQRVLMQLLLNIKKDAFKEDIEAVRILGMTPQGQQYLKCLKEIPKSFLCDKCNKKTATLFEKLKDTYL